MKIGIVTFHCVYNYGAVLQAYALQRHLLSKGNDVYIVDYRPEELTCQYVLNPFGKKLGLKKRLSLLVAHKWRALKNLRFNNFIKSMLITTNKIYVNDSDFVKNPMDFDIYICGSDQVWNPEIFAGEIKKPYFLNWKMGADVKKIAYAASFGSDFIKEKNAKPIGQLLNNIDFISVRENSAVSLIKHNYGIDAMQVLDPVFLLSSEEWLQHCKVDHKKDRYMLTYMLTRGERLVAAKLAYKMGLRLVALDRFWGKMKPPGGDLAPGPLEFLGLFNSAECVVTNSFHGTAFSIIFKKPFLSFCRGPRHGRVKNLLASFGLESQMINDNDGFVTLETMIAVKWFNNIQVIKNVDCLIDRSKKYLSNSIKC